MSITLPETLIRVPPVRKPAREQVAVARPTRRYDVITCRSAADAAPYLASWAQLAATALEVNPFYEPWMLLPALSLFGSRNTEIALVCETDPNAGGRVRVIGVFPLEYTRSFRGLPIRTVRLWKHPHCFLCTPLICSDATSECWNTFFAWLKGQRRGTILQMPCQAVDGPYFHELLGHIRQSGQTLQLQDLYARAVMKLDRDAETYMQQHMGKSTLKTLRSRRKKLEEQGALQSLSISAEADIEPWLCNFLKLEASGWKGNSGTAMGCSPVNQDYFRQICTAAHQQGRLAMLSLELNGEPIAMQVDVHAGQAAFGFKIAFDDRFSRFSPGMVLVQDSMIRAHTQRRMDWMDCCAAAGNETTNHLWGQRRMIGDILLSTGRPLGELFLSILPLARYVRRCFGKSKAE